MMGFLDGAKGRGGEGEARVKKSKKEKREGQFANGTNRREAAGKYFRLFAF